MQQRLKQMRGLAQRLPLHRAQALVPLD